MLAESFSRYIREFRKPFGKKRSDIIKKLNMKKQYCQIKVEGNPNDPKKEIIKKAMKVQLPSDKEQALVQVFDKPDEMKKLRGRLDQLN